MMYGRPSMAVLAVGALVAVAGAQGAVLWRTRLLRCSCAMAAEGRRRRSTWPTSCRVAEEARVGAASQRSTAAGRASTCATSWARTDRGSSSASSTRSETNTARSRGLGIERKTARHGASRRRTSHLSANPTLPIPHAPSLSPRPVERWNELPRAGVHPETGLGPVPDARPPLRGRPGVHPKRL